MSESSKSTEGMPKYVRVEWPEIQWFMEGKRWKECLLVANDDSPSSYMIPESYYIEVVTSLQQNIHE